MKLSGIIDALEQFRKAHGDEQVEYALVNIDGWIQIKFVDSKTDETSLLPEVEEVQVVQAREEG